MRFQSPKIWRFGKAEKYLYLFFAKSLVGQFGQAARHLGVSEFVIVKETTLERAAFYAGWSELSWSGRTQLVLA